MISFRSIVCLLLVAFSLTSQSRDAAAQTIAAQSPMATPWGVSASASSYKNHAEWFPKMRAAGVTSVRLFPEWRGLEPQAGKWNWTASDALVKSAQDNKIEITAVLMGSPAGDKAVHAFPMDDLPGWSKFVTSSVERYESQIHYWEVWNEGNAGFNDGHHTTADYAKLASVTYAAVKKADANAQVGLTVASYDAPYLHQTIKALAKSGQANEFDYLCIHPYEVADGLANPHGEIPFLWMTHQLREMLQASAPEKAKAEIWITEVGRRIDSNKNRAVTPRTAAHDLVKIYTMALAQGIARVQWFEAQDPQGEEAGFGLISRDGQARESYQALQSLAKHLGPHPKYLGWLALGEAGRGYGFVFEGVDGPVLVAWMTAGEFDDTLSRSDGGQIIDPLTGRETPIKASLKIELSRAPLLITGLSAELVKQAKANVELPFPWGGNYSQIKTVSFQPGAKNAIQGIVPVGHADCPTIKFADGSTGILVEGDIGHPVSFYVHPSFAKFTTQEYYVRVTARRVAQGNVGMNLLYEVADSQGRGAYANAQKWFGVNQEEGWQSYTWHVNNACFSKMWGYDIVIRPEQSIPFAIGKIEVSTVPFK